MSLPEETRANGSLHAVVYIHKAGVSPLDDNRGVHHAASLTTYTTARHTGAQRDAARQVNKHTVLHIKPAVLPKSPTVCVCPYFVVFVSFKEGSYRLEALVSHWKPHLSITVLSTDFPFNKAGLPSDLRRRMRV